MHVWGVLLPTSERKRWLGGLAALCVGLMLAAPAQGQTKEGEARLLELKGLDVDRKAQKIEVGKTVVGHLTCYINPDLFGKKVVEVAANVKNNSGQVMHFGLHVAFFDKDKKLIGCCIFGGEAFSSRLEPKGFSFTTKNIALPPAMLGRIARYQVSLVSDDKELGKK